MLAWLWKLVSRFLVGNFCKHDWKERGSMVHVFDESFGPTRYPTEKYQWYVCTLCGTRKKLKW